MRGVALRSLVLHPFPRPLHFLYEGLPPDRPPPSDHGPGAASCPRTEELARRFMLAFSQDCPIVAPLWIRAEPHLSLEVASSLAEPIGIDVIASGVAEAALCQEDSPASRRGGTPASGGLEVFRDSTSSISRLHLSPCPRVTTALGILIPAAPLLPPKTKGTQHLYAKRFVSPRSHLVSSPSHL